MAPGGRVREEHGHAVGDAHRNGMTRARLRNESIGLLLEHLRRIARCHDERRTVHLMHLEQARGVEADRCREPPLVLPQGDRIAQRREVETVERRLAHAPRACGKAMRKMRRS